MVDDTAQHPHDPRHDHPVSVTFVDIVRVLDTIKHDARRIQRSAQRPAMDAIDERHAIAGYIGLLAKLESSRTRRSLSS